MSILSRIDHLITQRISTGMKQGSFEEANFLVSFACDDQYNLISLAMAQTQPQPTTGAPPGSSGSAGASSVMCRNCRKQINYCPHCGKNP